MTVIDILMTLSLVVSIIRCGTPMRQCCELDGGTETLEQNENNSNLRLKFLFTAVRWERTVPDRHVPNGQRRPPQDVRQPDAENPTCSSGAAVNWTGRRLSRRCADLDSPSGSAHSARQSPTPTAVCVILQSDRQVSFTVH